MAHEPCESKKKEQQAEKRSPLERDLTLATKNITDHNAILKALMGQMSSLEDTKIVTVRSFPACNTDA